MKMFQLKEDHEKLLFCRIEWGVVLIYEKFVFLLNII